MFCGNITSGPEITSLLDGKCSGDNLFWCAIPARRWSHFKEIENQWHSLGPKAVLYWNKVFSNWLFNTTLQHLSTCPNPPPFWVTSPMALPKSQRILRHVLYYKTDHIHHVKLRNKCLTVYNLFIQAVASTAVEAAWDDVMPENIPRCWRLAHKWRS